MTCYSWAWDCLEFSRSRQSVLVIPLFPQSHFLLKTDRGLLLGGEAEDDQKRMFSRWQPSDLWAPVDDAYRHSASDDVVDVEIVRASSGIGNSIIPVTIA
ncbi:hypothetical protein J6590_106931 [Homalodisca vitripennis]|nr:hypothetical protein J6590_106931 [Homalodisca vitripennis]